MKRVALNIGYVLVLLWAMYTNLVADWYTIKALVIGGVSALWAMNLLTK